MLIAVIMLSGLSVAAVSAALFMAFKLKGMSMLYDCYGDLRAIAALEYDRVSNSQSFEEVIDDVIARHARLLAPYNIEIARKVPSRARYLKTGSRAPTDKQASNG